MEERYRFWWNILLNSKDVFHQSCFRVSSLLGPWVWVNGCKDNFSSWQFRGRDLHGITRRIFIEKERASTWFQNWKKKPLWVETNTKIVVSEVWLIHDESWFRRALADPCVYFRQYSYDCFMMLHVGDVLIIRQDAEFICKLKRDSSNAFNTKDLGPDK